MHSVSVGEFLYRVRQFVRNRFFDRLAEDDFGVSLPIPDCGIIDMPDAHLFYPIFDNHVDIFKEIDWHLDVSTGKQFPSVFANDIDVFSGRNGNVKYVWEVNRMQFLLHFAITYEMSKDLKYLVLFCHYLATWRETNPYMLGVNWFSNIEVNLRLICWFFCWRTLDVDYLRKHDSAIDEFIGDVWMPIVCEHAEYSYLHPSLYSSANSQLVVEYVGLFLATVEWKIPHWSSRQKYAISGLEREILRQNTSEGVNREESAEYVQFVGELFLMAAIVGKSVGIEFSPSYNDRLYAMGRYMNAFLDSQFNNPMYGDIDDEYVLRTDVDGHFNNFKSLLVSFATYFEDSSFKREGLAWDEKNTVLFGVDGKKKFESLPCAPVQDGNSFFVQSGHFIFRKAVPAATPDGKARETFLHFDAAPLGYLSVAAHGHADALSFVLHVDGHPVFVDPGSFSDHTHADLRRYFVGTIAHNTVCVNGKNQAEQVGPTMWLNHYRVNVVSSDEGAGEVTASHDGYASDGVMHTRQVKYDRDKDEFVITDTLQCAHPVSLEIPFHLHPDASVDLHGSTAEVLVPGCRRVTVELDKKLSYAVREDGWYSEHFAKKTPAKFLYAKIECFGDVKFETKLRIRG